MSKNCYNRLPFQRVRDGVENVVIVLNKYGYELFELGDKKVFGKGEYVLSSHKWRGSLLGGTQTTHSPLFL
jgi:hypothetical protein